MVSTPWWPRLQRIQVSAVVRDEVLDLRACTQLTWLHCSGTELLLCISLEHESIAASLQSLNFAHGLECGLTSRSAVAFLADGDCNPLPHVHAGPAGFRNGRTLAELPRALLPPTVVTLCLANLKSQVQHNDEGSCRLFSCRLPKPCWSACFLEHSPAMSTSSLCTGLIFCHLYHRSSLSANLQVSWLQTSTQC